MPEYNYNLPSDSTAQTPPSVPFQAEFSTASRSVQNAILHSFLWMSLGLLITAAVAFGVEYSGMLYWMISSGSMLVMAFPILQIVLAMSISMGMQRFGITTLRVLFVLFAASMGLTLSVVLLAYGNASVYLALLTTGLYFGCLVFIGLTTRKNLAGIGVLCITGLFVMLISQIVMIFMGVDSLSRMMCIIGLLIFTGLTAFDVQRMKQIMMMENGQMVALKKMSIFFAMQLFLDFINMFLYILRLIGIGSSNRN